MKEFMHEEERKRSPIIKTVRSAVALVVESGNIKNLIFTTVWVLLGAVTSFEALFQKNFINGAAGLLGGTRGAIQTAVFWLAIWAGVKILTNVANLFSGRAGNRMWIEFEYFVQKKVFHKVGKLRMKYFDDIEAQRKINFVRGGFSQRVSSVTQSVINLLRNASILVSAAAIIIGENWMIAGVILLTMIPAIWVSRAQTDATYRMNQRGSFEVQMQNYLASILTKRKFLKDLRFYQLHDYMEDRYDASVQEVLVMQQKLNRRYFLVNLGADMLTYAGIAVALLMISVRIFHGDCGIGSFLLVYNTGKNLQNAIKSIFSSLDSIGDNGRYLEDYKAVMNFEEETLLAGDKSAAHVGKRRKKAVSPADPDGKRAIAAADGKAGKAAFPADTETITITFDHVSFTYPGAAREALHDINLTIRQGEHIAIFGENGSGKSTFVSLISGLYQPTKGRILINGRDLQENLGAFRSRLACAAQDFLHLEGTIEENVRIGDTTQNHTPEEIRDALKKADVLSYVDSLPKGIESNLGNLFDESVDISGGQWQKLEIARNLLKTQAKVVILDEPTAALDPLAESRFYRHFAALMKGKSAIMISHRLGAAQLAKRVLVFSSGRIVADGTHTDLLKTSPAYTEMYHAQAQWYVSA